MEYDDIPAFAAVDAVAMAEYGMAQAVFANDTSGKTRQQLVVDWTRKGFVNDDKQVWLKVTDTDCGNEMVAAAFWRFQFEEPASSKGGSVESLLSEAEKQQKSEGGPRSVIEEMGRLAAEFKQEFVGTKPHACTRRPRSQTTLSSSALLDLVPISFSSSSSFHSCASRLHSSLHLLAYRALLY